MYSMFLQVHETNRFVGPHTHSQMQSGLSDISMRNISTEARNKFRALTSFMTRSDESHKPSGPKGGKMTSDTKPHYILNAARGVSVDEKLCDGCRQLRCQNQDLSDTLSACNTKLISLETSLQMLDVPTSDDSLKARIKEQEMEKRTLDNKVRATLLFFQIVQEM